MKQPFRTATALIVVACLTGCALAAAPPPAHSEDGDGRITGALEPIRQKHDVPALAGAIVTGKGLVAIGAVGVRKRGGTEPVTIDDQWHLGSDTKAMTATIIADLVEHGRLKWDTTVSDVFPEMKPSFNSDMQNVTLLQVLSHRAGLPENLAWQRISQEGTVQEQRLKSVSLALSNAPETKPGSTFKYSNVGYVIAGAVIERTTGKPWEDVIKSMLFEPLHMDSAGFGGVGTPGKIDQPWGHTENSKPVATNGPMQDNPPVMSPAGRVHCTIQDWAKFVADQLRGERGEQALLKAESYQKLHTPPFGGEYALGWGVAQREWGGGKVLNHNGSNTMNLATVWMAPKRDFAVLICTNQGGTTARKACDEAAGALIRIQNETR